MLRRMEPSSPQKMMTGLLNWKFIRRTRIDEIPQFINVLKGEMSVVGPKG